MSPVLSKALNAPGVATTRPNRKSGSLGVSSIAEFLLSGICSLLLVGRVLRHEKANALPGRACAHGRPRCQGRRGEPFIGAQRRPLTEERCVPFFSVAANVERFPQAIMRCHSARFTYSPDFLSFQDAWVASDRERSGRLIR